MSIRTDLALEAKSLYERSAGDQTQNPGVWARKTKVRGIEVTTLRILDSRGEQALGKPAGTYTTVELDALMGRDPGGFSRTVHVLARNLRGLLGSSQNVLVAGLGNRSVTPDAVGPLCLESLIVTRHLKQLGGAFSCFGTVSAVEPGVLGTTGMESAELVQSLTRKLQPEAVICVDALAAGSLGRLLSSVQLTDTGIVPGSGVQNSRAAINRETLGVPVVAVGVPTVVDASGWARTGEDEEKTARDMVLTPRDIDLRVRQLAKVLGYSLDLALHPGLTLEMIPCFLP